MIICGIRLAVTMTVKTSSVSLSSWDVPSAYTGADIIKLINKHASRIFAVDF